MTTLILDVLRAIDMTLYHMALTRDLLLSLSMANTLLDILRDVNTSLHSTARTRDILLRSMATSLLDVLRVAYTSSWCMTRKRKYSTRLDGNLAPGCVESYRYELILQDKKQENHYNTPLTTAQLDRLGAARQNPSR